MKHALITGADCFIGSHPCNAIIKHQLICQNKKEYYEHFVTNIS